jgi:hypothetical protein
MVLDIWKFFLLKGKIGRRFKVFSGAKYAAAGPTRHPEHVHHPAKCTTMIFHTSLSLNNYKIVNEEDIKAALAEIEMSKDLNYRKIARNYKLTYTTLLRRVKG